MSQVERAAHDHSTFSGWCFLSTLSGTVNELNATILDRLPAPRNQTKTYPAVDSQDTDAGTAEDEHLFAPEILQSVDMPSLPPSQLRLKVGAPGMLLRNLCPKAGLCNGLRMVGTQLQRLTIQVRMLGADFDGEIRVIPRILFVEEKTPLGVGIRRKQLPVRLCFAMTVNKSRGQSFHTVALDLRAPVFSPGQLYVALSRTSEVAGLAVLLPKDSGGGTKNVVYPEVLPRRDPPPVSALNSWEDLLHVGSGYALR